MRQAPARRFLSHIVIPLTTKTKVLKEEPATIKVLVVEGSLTSTMRGLKASAPGWEPLPSKRLA